MDTTARQELRRPRAGARPHGGRRPLTAVTPPVSMKHQSPTAREAWRPLRQDPLLGGGALVTARRTANLVAVVLPPLAVVLAAALFWNEFVEPVDLVMLAVGYALTCVGITVGFHRLLTHRAFQTYPSVRYTLAVLGTLAVEGSAIKWVADHRRHHAFADEDGDPHSPHGGGPGVLGAARGLWHAHLGWLFTTVGQADRRRYGADLLKDRGICLIDALEKPLILASLAIPFLLGLAIKGSFTGALLTLVWAGLLRIFLLHHATSASTRSAISSGGVASPLTTSRPTWAGCRC
jgi:stearoyl-CoA desaturase (Delta-9 desaturase)